MEVEESFFTPYGHPFELTDAEPVDCNLCGGANYRPLGRELGFDIRECTDCGLVYVTPQPKREDLPTFYAGMYPEDTESEARSRTLGATERHLRRIVLHRKPNLRRLLEVGCGYGLFLEKMSDVGCELNAVEFSETAIQFVRRNVPAANVQQGDMEDAEFPPDSMDCIVLDAVFEHFKNPREALRRLTHWLAPGGLLVLQVPYMAPYMKVKRWLPWLPVTFAAPRHLFDFPPKVLRRYLAEFEYQDIQIEVARPYSSEGPLGAALIWGVKIPGLVLHWLTAGRYIYPFAAATVAHALKPNAR